MTTTAPAEPTQPTEPPPEPAADAAPARSRRRPHRRWPRRVAAAAAVAAAAGVAAVAALGGFGGDGGGTPAVRNLPPATAEITRTTLVASEEFDGTLGYGDATLVTVPAASGAGAASGGAGIVTWRPGVGDVIEPGEPVYSVNAEPVVLLSGSMPFFRQLGDGNTGPDVAQLEANLTELGYDGFTADNTYTEATAEVVEQWQADLGWPETGRLDPARVVVAPGSIRVSELLAPLGGAATGNVLSYTGTDRQITVTLDVADQQLVAEDLPVTVTLPDGSTVDGKVTEVGTVATAAESEEAGGLAPQQESVEPTTVDVTITVDDPEALGDWDAAPVDVTLETDRRQDVLAVPVEALVALAEGGYGVQVVDGETTRYEPVETGLYADGRVEIEGAGITEGMLVGVPS